MRSCDLVVGRTFGDFFYIVSREPADVSIAYSLPPSSFDDIGHFDEVTLVELELEGRGREEGKKEREGRERRGER